MPLKIESQGNGSREMKFVAQALFLSGMGPFVCRLSPTNVKICCFNGLALELGKGAPCAFPGAVPVVRAGFVASRSVCRTSDFLRAKSAKSGGMA